MLLIFLSELPWLIANQCPHQWIGHYLSTVGSPFDDLIHFYSIVGALQYLVITCLDITHNFNMVCQFMHAPREDHYQAVKHILH